MRRRAVWLVVIIAAATCCKARRREPAPPARAEEDAGEPSCGSNADCAGGQYCMFLPGLCGTGTRPGVCRSRPSHCDVAFSPVCGCDKRVYDSDCAAHAVGVDLAVAGGCDEPRPVDWIACGPRFCNARAAYCEIVLSDVPDPPTDYACKPLPPACVPEGNTARTCDCFPAGTRCLGFCGYIDTGGVEGFHLTCRL